MSDSIGNADYQLTDLFACGLLNEMLGVLKKYYDVRLIAGFSATLFGVGVLVVLIYFISGTPLKILLGDPLQVAQGSKECCSVAMGALTNVGVMFWVIGAGALLTAGAVSRCRRDIHASNAFFTGAALTLWLGIDDMFMFHERVLPSLGISEKVVLTALLTALIFYLLNYRRILLNAWAPAMIIALGFFSISILVDQLHPPLGRLHSTAEDGSKLFGIASWTFFHVHLAVSWLLEAHAKT